MKLDKGMILADRYEILEQIGSGGMAIVYRAMDLKLDRDVTFKVLREEYALDEDFLSRFNVEARSAAALSHHNIVKVYDVGSENNINYIVMEYIDGVTLKDLIIKRGSFENEETLGVAIQIASALSHAHKNGIIHRDIKPQNILVTKTGEVKVTDFGIARSASNKTTTTTSNTMGSVHYFSPEQARGKYVDSRSDIYSLGITMYEMSTGELPYDGDTAVSIALKHLNEPLPDMIEINEEISQSVEKIILKATSKSTVNRYASADEMLIDLKRAITNESGDFVNMGKSSAVDSSTIVLDNEDFSTIRGNSSRNRYDDEDDYGEEDQYDDDYNDDYDDQIDKKTERKVIIAAICTAIAIIAIIFAIGLNILKKDKKGNTPNANKPAVMLNITGKTLVEAEQMLEELGVTIGEKEYKPSSASDEGLIIDQNPKQGTEINSGDTVGVIISSGVSKIKVPSLIGKTSSQVYDVEEFANASLIIKDERVHSDEFELGQIIDQDPKVGTEVPKGSTVTVFISKGKSKTEVTVPNVKSLSETNAKRLLIDSGFRVDKVDFEFNDEYDIGIVCAQSVEGGQMAQEGSIVNITLSKGKNTTEQPSETPAPTPSATPTPSENTQQPTTTPNPPEGDVVKTKTVKIIAPVADSGPVNIKVEQTNADGTKTTIYDDIVSTEGFPFFLTIKGKGKVVIAAYSDGNQYPYAQETVDFSN